MNYRILNYKKLGYGLFIHYGLYSKFGEGEWYWNMNKLTKDEYYKKVGPLSEIDWKPDFYNIVKNAKEWGFNYIVLTARHHDGFSLYDTKGLSNFDITKTKNKVDLVKEFVDACNKFEIKPVIYHTTLDWSVDLFEKDFNKYLEYLYKSVEILTKNYGDVAGFWFDGNWSKLDEDWKENELYSMIRNNQPNAIIANNTGLNDKGKLKNDFLEIVTYEQGAKSEELKQVDNNAVKEICETINDHWGYAKNDYNFKSVPQLIRNLVNARLNDANYLINIGLNDNDEISGLEKETFSIVGDWILNNGQSLFGDSKIILHKNNVGVIEKDDSYYIFLDGLKSGGHVDEIAYGSQELKSIELDGFKHKIIDITSLDEKVKTDFIQKGQVLTIKPKSYKYGFNSVIKVYKCLKEKNNA